LESTTQPSDMPMAPTTRPMSPAAGFNPLAPATQPVASLEEAALAPTTSPATQPAVASTDSDDESDDMNDDAMTALPTDEVTPPDHAESDPSGGQSAPQTGTEGPRN